MRKILCISMILVFSLIASFSFAKGLELSFFLGMKDGSENSDGVIVTFAIEEGGKATSAIEQLWSKQQWSDKFTADLTKWAGKTVTLKLTTDPGKARNTGWDWILIGDAKITNDDKLVFDIGQAVADNKFKPAIVVDGDNKETDKLGFGATCAPDAGPSGKQAKPKSFMQHPPWDGKVGNTISRYDVALPSVAGGVTAVDKAGKATTTWGALKAY